MPITINGSGTVTGISAGGLPDGVITRPDMGYAGAVLQVVNFQTGTLATGTATIPADNSKPQNTEGTEFMSLSITPTSSASKLLINVCTNVSHSLSGTAIIAALFRDSGADALATAWVSQGVAGEALQVNFDHYLTSGTTSATTFKVRAGAAGAGTTSFNGVSGAGYFNATYASSITITEIAA